MLQYFKSFYQRMDGSVATSIAILALPLMLFCGATVDYTSLHRMRSNLQDAADAAALASAKELGLVSTKDETVKTVASDYVIASLNIDLKKKELQSTEIKTTISPTRKDVTVDIAYTWTPLFIQHIDSSTLPIKVSATASLAGEQSICVLALDNSASAAIDMTSKANMIANDCVIYSNSSSSQGIAAVKQATMKGSEIMSSGGYGGPASSFLPMPITDTPAIDDPLKGRAQPIVGTICNERDFYSDIDVTLLPGVYCGGITLEGKAVATLIAGDYIIKDGPLSIMGNSSLVGDDVGFFLTGDKAVFDFGVSTQAVLSARKTGPMSGVLFFEDRASPDGRLFAIRSKDAEKFEGAIYLPKGTLWIDKASKIGQKSSWTAIIAKRISIGNGPDILINSDYANSTIPVPSGIGGGSSVRLKR